MKIIYCSDLHLREDRPICRKDEDWSETQRLQLNFIANTAAKHSAIVLIGGDIFHRPQVPDYIKNMFISAFLGLEVYAIAGQHDLPWHMLEKIDQSSFGVLRNSGVIKDPVFCGYAHYGQEPTVKNGMVVIHESIFATAKDCPPGMKAYTAVEIFDKYPDAKWILSGDIHHGFCERQQGRHLIMGGCMNRQASDMIDYEPKIWFIDTDTDEVRSILIPDDVSMVTDIHIQNKEEREDRITAFVTSIKESKTVSLDFSDNVELAIKNDTELAEGVVNKIYELMEAK